MSIPLYTVDAFSSEPFGGNAAAVCLLSQPQQAGWMQSVAAEMNLSETAFLWKQDDFYQLRWYTPTGEVDLCGHATLAAAHILWQNEFLPYEQSTRFQTRSGLLTAAWRDGWIELDFPATPVQSMPPNDILERALGTRNSIFVIASEAKQSPPFPLPARCKGKRTRRSASLQDRSAIRKGEIASGFALAMTRLGTFYRTVKL